MGGKRPLLSAHIENFGKTLAGTLWAFHEKTKSKQIENIDKTWN